MGTFDVAVIIFVVVFVLCLQEVDNEYNLFNDRA